MGLDRRVKAAVVVVMVMGGMQTITQTSSSKPSAVCEAHGSHSALCRAPQNSDFLWFHLNHTQH